MTERRYPASGRNGGGLTIRRLGGDDREAVARLARRDSRPPLDGPLLGVEVEGRLLAAISLRTRETVADPSSRAVELRALLELRAAQLHRRENHWHRRRPHHTLGSRARAALPGSPPGAPSWLIAHRPKGF
jgi:hypothetical protein